MAPLVWATMSISRKMRLKRSSASGLRSTFILSMAPCQPDVPAELDEAHAYIRARVPNFRTYTSWGHDEAIIGGYYDAVLAINALDNRGRPTCWTGSIRARATACASSIGSQRP